MWTLRTLLMTMVFIARILTTSPPVLSIEDAKLTVTFDAGAIFACTQYENQNVLGKDNKLETVHDCGFIDETIGTFTEPLIWTQYRVPKGDYRVFVEIGYPRRGEAAKGENAGTTYVDYVTSNAIKVVN